MCIEICIYRLVYTLTNLCTHLHVHQHIHKSIMLIEQPLARIKSLYVSYMYNHFYNVISRSDYMYCI